MEKKSEEKLSDRIKNLFTRKKEQQTISRQQKEVPKIITAEILEVCLIC